MTLWGLVPRTAVESLMPSSIVVSLDCPHCAYRFLEAASLVRPHASAYCPACGHTFCLDPEIAAMSRLLSQAKAARQERKRRRQEIRDLFGPQKPLPAPAPPPPQQLGEVLARLDAVLEQMRASEPAQRKRA